MEIGKEPKRLRAIHIPENLCGATCIVWIPRCSIWRVTIG